jgi:hypothetical protein
LAEPEPPPEPPAVGRLLPELVPPVGHPALEDDLHPAHPVQAALEIFEERHVGPADHDQELDVGERQGRKRREEQRRVPRTVPVGFGGIVERRLLAQVPGAALDTARCADDFHSAREPLPPPAIAVGRL